MRAAPTASLVSTDIPVTGIAYNATYAAPTSGTLSLTTTAMTASGGYIILDGLSGLTVGQAMVGTSVSAFLDLSAEI